MQILDLEDINHVTWEKCNPWIHSWLINYVSDPITQTIFFHENPIDV